MPLSNDFLSAEEESGAEWLTPVRDENEPYFPNKEIEAKIAQISELQSQSEGGVQESSRHEIPENDEEDD